MKTNTKDFIEYLETQKTWLTAEEISTHFDTSTKTVFNYIKRINDYQNDLILSSTKGYMINEAIDYDRNSLFFNDSLSGRTNYVLRQLLTGNEKEIDVYQIADNLFVSDSYVEALIKHIKYELSKYSLTLHRSRNKIHIEGLEINKRRLISSLITSEKALNYSLGSASSFANKDVDVNLLQEIMVKLFKKYSVYVNDYGFNTILIYLAVTITRIKQNMTIHDFFVERSLDESIENSEFLISVKEALENSFSISLPKHEYYYLSLIIKNNCNAYDLVKINIDNIKNYVDNYIVDKTLAAIIKMEKQYHLDQFDDSFKIKIILHIQMLKERLGLNASQSNPMAQRIKNTYPFIYDMATYLIKEIFDNNVEHISDEEISFLAIHIGAYLDRSITNNNKLKCCFVYADYHRYYEHLISDIYDHYNQSLNIVSRTSIKYSENLPDDIDCIISNYPLVKTYNHPVFIIDDIMFNNNSYISKLQSFIDNVTKKKMEKQFKLSLEKFVSNDLFSLNIPITKKDNVINFLCAQANKLGYCKRDFYNEILERESISSTAFDSCIAIPHSLYQNCSKSFLSIVINDKGIEWDEKVVNLVIMIGVNYSDNRDFQIVLNTIIPFLTSKQNVQKLLNSNSYSEFIKILVDNVYNEN